MPDRNPARLTVPLSEEEIDELDDFLMSDAVTDEAMMLDQLDGYLTAIIIGPVTLRMQDWLPGIWGPGEELAPEFETLEQAQRILDLITRHMNGIVWSFQDDPDAFEPLFNIATYGDDSKEYLDAEMWSHAGHCPLPGGLAAPVRRCEGGSSLAPATSPGGGRGHQGRR